MITSLGNKFSFLSPTSLTKTPAKSGSKPRDWEVSWSSSTNVISSFSM